MRFGIENYGWVSMNRFELPEIVAKIVHLSEMMVEILE